MAYPISMKLSKLCLWAIAGTVVLTICTYFIRSFLIMPQFSQLRILVLGILILLSLCVALGCAVALEKGRMPQLMRTGIVSGAIALSGWIAMGFYNDGSAEGVWNTVLVWPTSWACLMMAIGLLLLPEPRSKWWIHLRRVTIALFVLLGATICLAVSFHPGDPVGGQIFPYDYEHYERVNQYEKIASKIGFVIGFLACGGALFVWLAVVFVKPATIEDSTTNHSSYWLTCPRCGSQQQAMTGSDTCNQCNLQIKVQLA